MSHTHPPSDPTPTMTSDKPTKTSYLILVEMAITAGSDKTSWREVGTIEATGADSAIRQHIKAESGEGNGPAKTYAAVPVRSFTKRTPRIVTETRLVLE